MFILNKAPMFGFNSSFRIDLAVLQEESKPVLERSVLSTEGLKDRIWTLNVVAFMGCIPLIGGIPAGAFHIYCAYQLNEAYQKDLRMKMEEDPDHAINPFQEREFKDLTCKAIGLGIAEIMGLGPILLILHIAATIFDHCIVWAHYCPSSADPL